MILVRTNLNISIGLGHYMRMTRLARELKKFKEDVIILIDKPNVQFETNEFKHYYLYPKNNFVNEKEDAKKTKLFLNKHKVTKVVVDDYRLGYKWEKLIKNKRVQLTVFDDFYKNKHFCNIFVNCKLFTTEDKKEIILNLNKQSNLLIGPRYAILNKNLVKKNYNSSNFNITFYAGGGGDSKIFYEVINKLCMNNKNIKINLIISLNKNFLKKYLKLKKKYKNFNIYFKKKYVEVISRTDLYIGYQGNAIYENSYLKKLSIFFPSTSNQHNDSKHLNSLGHNFLTTKNILRRNKVIENLIDKIINNFKKLSDESFKNINLVDKGGASRVAKCILGHKKDSTNKKKVKNYSNKFRIKKINIQDMHRYLTSRNLLNNRSKMINKKKIELIDHYNWWLGKDFNSRETFKVCFNEKLLLFIWHKKIIINKNNYYVGGWHVADKECKINEILVALKWQLKRTNNNKNWLAVINKKNKAVLKLNKILGFTENFRDKNDYLSAVSYFKATKKKFKYFIYNN